MKTTEVAVIGGGISGMTFAYATARAGLDTIVLESEAQAGGCLRTHRTSEGFWFELGAHTCYNSYAGLLGIAEETIGLGRLLPRQKVPFRLLADGQIISIPKKLRFFELLRSAPRLFRSKKQGKTVREYYASIVGRRNYDELFTHLFAAVPSQNADQLPSEMLFKKRERRKDVLRSFTVEGGLQSITDAIADRSGIQVETGTEITSVSASDGGFEITARNGRTLWARYLCLAVAPPVASQLLRDSQPAIANQLARVATTEVISTGFMVRKERVPVDPFAGVIPLDGRFFSVVSRDTVPDSRYRGFTFHYAPHVAETERISTACETLRVDRNQLDDITSRSVQLPSPRLGHDKIVEEIDRTLAGLPVFITGNYFAGLSIEDCVSRSTDEAKRLQQERQ